MSKKKKNNLILYGIEIKKLEDLQLHFDMAKVLEYFTNGQLGEWLDSHYYENEAEKIEQLSKTDPDLEEKICKIIGVNPSEYVDSFIMRDEKIAKLKEYTDDPVILANWKNVALNQEDLIDLLDQKVDIIYLVNNTFTISLRQKGKTYIGVGDVVAVVRRDDLVDFDSLNISFKNVQVENNNEILLINKSSDEVYKLGRHFEYKVHDLKTAFKYYRKAVRDDNADAICHFAEMYEVGRTEDGDLKDEAIDHQKATELYQKAFKLRLKAAKNGDTVAMVNLGESYLGYNGVERNEEKAFEYFKAASDAGDFNGMRRLAGLYRSGVGTAQSFDKYLELLSKAAENGDDMAKYELDQYYKNKKSCFITTAVCDSFDKPDDCYELTAFRNFRDKWLITQSDGKTLIKEYYAVAPQIIANINRLSDPSQVYKTIWQKYLEPCLDFLRNDDNLSCKNKYIEMMHELKRQFL